MSNGGTLTVWVEQITQKAATEDRGAGLSYAALRKNLSGVLRLPFHLCRHRLQGDGGRSFGWKCAVHGLHRLPFHPPRQNKAAATGRRISRPHTWDRAPKSHRDHSRSAVL